MPSEREVNEANRSIHYLRAVANVGALSVPTCEHTGLDEVGENERSCRSLGRR